ncbi:MAG: ribokinase [Anaerolineaceae bacterium]|nr:MAG: ribokinase [Anaerolineaceae bacterium]
MKILNIGSLNIDYVYTVDHIVKEGETIASTRLESYCGGKGLNQSIALSRAGAKVYHMGIVGEDGEMLLEMCKNNDIDTSYLKQIEGKSGHAIIQVDKNAQNSILLYPGSNRMFIREYIDEVLKNFQKGDMLLLQNEINLVDYIVEAAYLKGLTIVLNPSPYNEYMESVDMSKISIFLMNEVEAAQIAGAGNPNDVLTLMKEKYPDAKVVLTLGEKGSIYQYKDQVVCQDAIKVNVVDTTAAGDTFTGYFLAGLLANKRMEQILQESAKAAAIAVSRKGAAVSIPYKSELES